MLTLLVGIALGVVLYIYRVEVLAFVKDAWSKIVGN